MTGNSSKLKQAMINIVKNSIEALDGEGVIRIWAYAKGEEVVIHIKDDGIGMDAADLERLGEAYFSNKSKGTGLGLMVTFRIIEAMQGTIHFVSEKGRDRGHYPLSRRTCYAGIGSIIGKRDAITVSLFVTSLIENFIIFPNIRRWKVLLHRITQ